MSIQSTKKIRIGISFDHPDEYPEVVGPTDCFAEFEPESTIKAMEDAIKWIEATPVRVGGPRPLLHQRPDVDLIWNISEGYGSKNRESWVPLICEMYQIPCSGSDAITMNLSLDKSATKQVAKSLGIMTSPWGIAKYSVNLNNNDIQEITRQVVHDVAFSTKDQRLTLSEYELQPVTAEKHQNTLSNFDFQPIWPLFVKPRYEGTGKGITSKSIVNNESELATEIERQFELYQQDLLIEMFLKGPEFTVALSGNPLVCHPVLERGLDANTGIGMHVMDAIRSRVKDLDELEKKDPKESDINDIHDYTLSHSLSNLLEEKLHFWSKLLCDEMRVLDYARLDFKMNDSGQIYFLEINTLPTFAMDNNFAILAELRDVSYKSFLGEILRSVVQRLGFKI